MAVTLKNKAVFLHIPKTGGTWVTSVLKRLGLKQKYLPHKHLDLLHFLRPEYLKQIDGLAQDEKPFIFTFVRDPLSWYESWFRYTKQEGYKQWGKGCRLKDYSKVGWHPFAIISDCVEKDFNQSIWNIYRKRPGFVTEMFSWYTEPDWVDYVGKQENLREDLAFVLDKMNLNYNRGVIAKSDREKVTQSDRVKWDPELKELVREAEDATYKRFDY